MRTFLAALIVVSCSVQLWAEPDFEELSTEEQNALAHRLIDELDSNSFRKREEATLLLAEHCRTAAPLLGKLIATQCSPEVKRRGFEVLVRGAASNNEATATAAHFELLKFQASDDDQLASMAHTALSGWRAKVRQQKIAAIESMGGMINTLSLMESVSTMYPVERPLTRFAAHKLAKAFDKSLAEERKISNRAEEVARALARKAPKKATTTGESVKLDASGPIPRHTGALLPASTAGPPVLVLDGASEEFVFLEAAPGFIVPDAVPSDESQTAFRITLTSSWTGGDKGVAHLSDLDNVTSVVLHEVSLTGDAIRHLVQVRTLKDLQIIKGTIEPAAFRAFRKVRPDVHVFATGEGYLGVNGSGGNKDGFVVEGAGSDGGAYHAGIRSGDTIATINEIPVKDLGDVSLFVFNRKAGYPFRIELIRDGEKKVVEGKIGQR